MSATMVLEEAMASLAKTMAESEEARRRDEEARRRDEEARRRDDEARRRDEEVRRRDDEARKREEEARKKRDEEYKKELEEYRKENDKRQKRFDQMLEVIGGVKLDFGHLVEFIVIPKIRKQINKYGHQFTMLSANKEYLRADGNIMLEVDLLLENCDEAMVVEIKTNYDKVKEISEHLKRLELLRKHESTTGMKGKKMFAGIVGITISKNVRELALKQGMYVMIIREEDDAVDIIQPATKGLW